MNWDQTVPRETLVLQERTGREVAQESPVTMVMSVQLEPMAHVEGPVHKAPGVFPGISELPATRVKRAEWGPSAPSVRMVHRVPLVQKACLDLGAPPAQWEIAAEAVLQGHLA